MRTVEYVLKVLGRFELVVLNDDDTRGGPPPSVGTVGDFKLVAETQDVGGAGGEAAAPLGPLAAGAHGECSRSQPGGPDAVGENPSGDNDDPGVPPPPHTPPPPPRSRAPTHPPPAQHVHGRHRQGAVRAVSGEVRPPRRARGSRPLLMDADSPEFVEFERLAWELQSVDAGALEPGARKAFFINTYNALVIHSLTLNPKRIKGFYSKMAYRIGGDALSLDDIEHGVLRGNTPHPGSGRISFKAGDPRLRLVLPLDPRIHVALNCGAMSCPGIMAYSTRVDDDLDGAARSFVASDCEVLEAKRAVSLSKIFKWYGADFGGAAGLLQWLLKYLEPAPKEQLSRMLDAGVKVKLAFTKYSWALNGEA